jgi:hypothetical protein
MDRESITIIIIIIIIIVAYKQAEGKKHLVCQNLNGL